MPSKGWQFARFFGSSALLGTFLLTFVNSANLRAQHVLYEHSVKVSLPSGWVERRAWEETPKESLPLYNANLEAVAFIHGSDQPDSALEPDRLKGLVDNGQLATVLETLLKDWPAEASRFYVMMAGDPSSPAGSTAGSGLKRGDAQYLGRLQMGSAEVGLAEWLSKDSLDGKLVNELKLNADFIGQRVEVLVGSVAFPSGGGGSTFTACRFVPAAAGAEWIKPLVEGMAPVPESEKSRAESQGRVREMVRQALQAARQQNYSQALGLAQQALALAPQDENALDVEGAVFLQQQKLDQAEAILRKATTINPRHENALFNLGATLLYQGKTDEAATEFEAVRRLCPLYPQIDDILKSVKSQ